MDQLLSIQPTTPQTVQIRSVAGDGQGNFSSHLSSALNDTRQAVPQGKQLSDKKDIQESAIPEAEEQTGPAEEAAIPADPANQVETEEAVAASEPAEVSSTAEDTEEAVAASEPAEVSSTADSTAESAAVAFRYTSILTLLYSAAPGLQEVLPQALQEFMPKNGAEVSPEETTADLAGLRSFTVSVLTELNRSAHRFGLTERQQAAIQSALADLQQLDSAGAMPLGQKLTVEGVESIILQNFAKGLDGGLPGEAAGEYPLHNLSGSAEKTISPQTSRQDQLISQLQNIIDNSSETGRVSISQTISYTGLYSIGNKGINELQYSPVVQQQTFVAGESGAETPSITVFQYVQTEELSITKAEPPQNRELNGVRADVKQQFYDAKIGGGENFADNTEDQGSAKDGEPTNQSGQQSGGTTQVNSTAAGKGEQTNTFAQTVPVTQETTTTAPASETPRPVIPFVSSLAHEQEVLQQLIEKFQVNFRKPETSLSIKLHPAELGELKIDLTVKEGSIRANVVAQSQHVQEILEKNLPRLRTVLEDQGFNVDQILVTADSESVGKFDLFDSNLARGGNDTATPQKKSPGSFSSFIVAEGDPTEPHTSGGVHVTA